MTATSLDNGEFVRVTACAIRSIDLWYEYRREVVSKPYHRRILVRFESIRAVKVSLFDALVRQKLSGGVSKVQGYSYRDRLSPQG